MDRALLIGLSIAAYSLTSVAAVLLALRVLGVENFQRWERLFDSLGSNALRIALHSGRVVAGISITVAVIAAVLAIVLIGILDKLPWYAIPEVAELFGLEPVHLPFWMWPIMVMSSLFGLVLGLFLGPIAVISIFSSIESIRSRWASILNGSEHSLRVVIGAIFGGIMIAPVVVYITVVMAAMIIIFGVALMGPWALVGAPISVVGVLSKFIGRENLERKAARFGALLLFAGSGILAFVTIASLD